MQKSKIFLMAALMVLGLCTLAQALTINKVTLENGEIVEVRDTTKGVVKYSFPDGVTVKVTKNIFGEIDFVFPDRGSVRLRQNEFGEVEYIFPSRHHSERLKLISKIQSIDGNIHNF